MGHAARTVTCALVVAIVSTAGAGGSPSRPRRMPSPPAAGDVLLWPAGAPGAVGTEPADIPRLTPLLPRPDRATGAAVVICPGGAYAFVAVPEEGRPAAAWLNDLGIAAFVLEYRVAPRYRHPAPSQDLARALRLVRARASEWGVDPARVGVMGFSAGGHLAATAATQFGAGRRDAPDPIERASARPAFAILVYPVITMGEGTHLGSRRNLLGRTAGSDVVALLSAERRVTAQTPPTFLVHAANDATVPLENSILFLAALRQAGVPHELHVLDRGGHGFGTGAGDPVLSQWPALAATWLRARGILNRGAAR